MSWELGANKVHLHYLEPSLALMEHFPEQKRTSCQPTFRRHTHQKTLVSLLRGAFLPQLEVHVVGQQHVSPNNRWGLSRRTQGMRPPTTHLRARSQCCPRPCPHGLASSLVAAHTPGHTANARISSRHAAADQKLWGSFFPGELRAAGASTRGWRRIHGSRPLHARESCEGRE